MATDPFGNLNVVETKLPESTKGRAAGPNPFEQFLVDSFNTNSGRQVVVAARLVKDAVRFIRRAADKNNIGARIVLEDSKGNTLDVTSAGDWYNKQSEAKVTVKFQGQKRRKKQARSEDSAPSVEEPATTDPTTDNADAESNE